MSYVNCLFRLGVKELFWRHFRRIFLTIKNNYLCVFCVSRILIQFYTYVHYNIAARIAWCLGLGWLFGAVSAGQICLK